MSGRIRMSMTREVEVGKVRGNGDSVVGSCVVTLFGIVAGVGAIAYGLFELARWIV